MNASQQALAEIGLVAVAIAFVLFAGWAVVDRCIKAWFSAYERDITRSINPLEDSHADSRQ